MQQGSPQLMQLVSSLMSGVPAANSNSNNAGPSFGNGGDWMTLAQQMGLFQQQPPQQQQQQQQQPTPTASVQNRPQPSASSSKPRNMPPKQKKPKVAAAPPLPAGASYCRPVHQPPTKKAKKSAASCSNTGASNSNNGQPTRIPCRARGMDMNHNFESAYFGISEDLPHGTPLVCSYPACRDKGVKFLYCAFCKDTGAKRQFRERHNHGADDETVKRSSQAAIDKKEAADTVDEAERASAVLAGMLHVKTADISSSEASNPNIRGRGKRKRPSMKASASLEQKNDQGDVYGLEGATTNKGAFSIELDEPMKKKLQSVQGERMNAWTALLLSRPQDNNDEGMSSWLMKVMAISDISRPIEQVIDCLQTNKMNLLSVGVEDEGSPGAAIAGSSAMSSTEQDDSNDSSSSSDTGLNVQDGSSNDSTEDCSGNTDEQDRASSSPSSPTDENESSDEERQDDVKRTYQTTEGPNE
ncbi:MAG: hypothetical protein SGILL_002518, partial [Bacillariaceae sp.]